MNDAMYIAATGIQAQKTLLDVVANNVANINTSGFKRSNVRFYDLMTNISSSQAPDVNGAVTTGDSIGMVSTAAGVGISAVGRQFDSGDLRQTGNSFDVAIRGSGFIEVVLPDGASGFFRGGSLQVNQDGLITTQEGYVLKQRVQVPSDAKGFALSPDGVIQASNSLGQSQLIGKLDLIQFSNPSALSAMGENIYRANEQTGEPVQVAPGDLSSGIFVQGYLEASNVRLVDEMLQLMVAQRAYEMNVKVMQAADEMVSLTNNLRK